MQTSLAVTALLMGLAGGPHCIAMCGAACAGIGKAAGKNSTSAIWTFQAGRLVSYSALGAVAAASMQGMGWLTTQTAVMRPVWTMFHVAAMVLGLTLLLLARQPVWLDTTAKRVWNKVRDLHAVWGRGAPLGVGLLWAFMPCGLLYSALLVAALSGGPLDGALTMALFALGSSVSLMIGPWLLLRLRGGGTGEWGIRLAGLALAATSGWALWMGLVHNAAPWCVTS
ncbi:MAG: sulfite exporter TauE/SafE family protein [Polaromonas sp.]|uniref:sulfite exporter TauE/SafE family protein n=1 Tax=Polaromonas sp. TaxID=1869339 RepID=UPI0017FEF826|nr:sulfite exporter TauE/SafE family protein [Polaromonas sp.]NMM11352.1 sulfite exporter TauE/SafE family protein [Polaromonas sp.]